MTGDQSDFTSRLWAVLPKRWFAGQSPNLGTLLSSIAIPWVWLYDLIMYVMMQTRLGTATDEWLDLVAVDYFGSELNRKVNEADFSYRSRIKAALLQEAATRSAVTAGLESLTGVPPVIFEPGNCRDTGCYGGFTGMPQMPGTGMAYGQTGGWGSLQLPLQFFVTVTRPLTPGVGMLAGYATSAGGYGEGSLSYVDLSLLPGHVTDQGIQAALCNLLPVNAVAWLRII
jgi:hypothetical protein